MSESSQKLDLIRSALDIHRQQLPPESSIAHDLKAEIEATQTMSPGSMTFTNIGDPFSTSSQQGMSRNASQRSSTSFSRTSSVTGKLEVQWWHYYLNQWIVHSNFFPVSKGSIDGLPRFAGGSSGTFKERPGGSLFPQWCQIMVQVEVQLFQKLQYKRWNKQWNNGCFKVG